MDMISPWLRPDNENAVCAFGERGGAGDNTIQEIFKVMEECALTSAYVVADGAGRVRCWNCTAEYEEGILCIAPDEETVVGIHLNLSGDVEVEVVLPGNRIRKSCPAGMRWIGNIPSLIK